MMRFTELEPSEYRDAILIIDVDGTLTNDNNHIVDFSVKHQLRQLAAVARIYLCSNSRETARFRDLAKETGTTYIETPFSKPDVRILSAIPDKEEKRLIVIGDKHLTDGRFAKLIGAEFVQVSRVKHKSDRVTIRASYLLDDIYGYIRRLSAGVAPYIKLARPLQWIKNLLVLSPIFFSGKLFDLTMVGESILAFVVFSLAASSVYAMNDLIDVRNDRLHPKKKFRPIASGSVPEKNAIIFIGILISILVIALALIPAILPVVLLYIGLNILYSFRLKHVAVVDITLVAIFYLLRVFAGGIATGVALSPWILLCVLFGSLCIIIGKRRAEINHDSRRAVLDAYSKETLDALLVCSAALSIISYGLYSILVHNSSYLIYSTIFVVFIFFRLLNDVYIRPNDAESPETLVFKDKWILGAVTLWIVYIFWFFYIAHIL